MEDKKIIKTMDIKSVGTFIISSQLKDKIDYLHKAIGAVEWSGILIYKLKSKSIKPMKDLIFVGYNIYPMDVGNSGATNFNYDGSVMNMYNVIPEAMDLNMGLAHSHHNMAAFFSGTDFTELTSNAEHYNFYVSLVVNFSGEYKCKIAFPSEGTTVRTSTIRDYNGKLITVKENITERTIIISDLKVVYENEIKLEDWFIKKVSDIKRENVARVKEYSNNNYNSYKLPVKKDNLPATQTNFQNEREKKVAFFLMSLLTMENCTLKEFEDKSRTLSEAVNNIIVATKEEYEWFKELLIDNISIIHDNVFGSEAYIYENYDIRCAIDMLSKFDTYPRIKSLKEWLRKYLEQKKIENEFTAKLPY